MLMEYSYSCHLVAGSIWASFLSTSLCFDFDEHAASPLSWAHELGWVVAGSALHSAGQMPDCELLQREPETLLLPDCETWSNYLASCDSFF
jgi:hypothetical protein